VIRTGRSQRAGRSGFRMTHLFALVLFFTAIPFLSGLIPLVRFSEEQIDIIVRPDHIRVRGIYVYENPLPLPLIQGLSIPLPINRDNPAPVLLRVATLMPDRAPVPVRHIMGSYRFELVVPAGSAVTVMVEYAQYAPQRNAHYLLTTTRPWRRPIERGEFSLVPEGVEITGSNYPLERTDTGIWFFRRDDFMPTQDWEFSWEEERS